jgi:hypothetical protein
MPSIESNLFQPNMGRWERTLRMMVGGLLVGLVYLVPTPWGWLGLYPLLTGFLSISPVRKLLHERAGDDLEEGGSR